MSPRSRYPFRVVLAIAWLAVVTALTAQTSWPHAEAWQRETVLNNRRDHAMVYHADTQEVILFGGTDRNTELADTWSWNGREWFPRVTAHAPGARTAHAMTYDAARKVTVLFGGLAVGKPLGDTWEWTGRDWVRITTAVAPSPRQGHVMTYDAVRRVVVLHGGSGGLNDTWTWDGRLWRQVKTTKAPPARKTPAAAFDATRGVTVLFGGREAVAGYTQSTWLFDGKDWAEVKPPAQAAWPVGRRGHVMAYSPSHRCVLVAGGYRMVNKADVWLNDVWAWDGKGWSVVAPANAQAGPAPRYRHAGAYDAKRGELVFFGGSHGSANVVLLSDTWRHPLNALGWKAATGCAPTARKDHAMSYDIWRRWTVLFGGDDGESPYRAFLNDTWIWDNRGWWPLATKVQPTGRRDHRMVYDYSRGEHLLFGGDDGNQRLLDTWTFRAKTRRWTRKNSLLNPPARSRHALAFGTPDRHTLLFGGFDGNMKLNDTWVWDGGQWYPVLPTVSPNRRSRHAMAYDIVRRRVVLFGGEGGAEANLADTWEWDGATWAHLTPKHSPPARSGHTMAFDLLRRRVVLYGGKDGAGPLTDAWAWDGKDWAPIQPISPPPARTRHTMVYNHGRQRLTVFGGQGRSKVVSDTWSLVPIQFRTDAPEVYPGGQVTFRAHVPTCPNQYYLTVVAFQKVPGFAAPLMGGTVDVPVFPDGLTLTCWNLTGFKGRLDGKGQASWKVGIHKDERLAGIRFFAALLALDKSNRVLAVTNDVTVAIVK